MDGASGRERCSKATSTALSSHREEKDIAGQCLGGDQHTCDCEAMLTSAQEVDFLQYLSRNI